MWEFYSVMDVLLVVPVSKFRFNDAVTYSTIAEESVSETELQLFSWFPYTSPTHCDKLKKVVLVDRWNSNGDFVIKANLFPGKIPRTFHRCPTKVVSIIYPPAVMEKSDKNYTGLEIKFVETVFKKLNLTAEYVISPKRHNSYYGIFIDTIQKLKPASSDIAIGVLPFDASSIDLVEASVPYLHIKVSWYVPCPKPTSHWGSLYKLLSLPVSKYFCVFSVLSVIIMWLMAKCETRLSNRESANYMTISYCTFNVWSVTTGMSVSKKPVSISLRIVFAVLVLSSFVITNMYQTYFIGLLVNPPFEKSLTTLNELLQSGIEYGYPGDKDAIQFSDPPYDIIKKNRKVCTPMFKCLERVIERKDFATVFDSFHAEYFKTRLLFHNIHVPICTLQEDVMIYRVSTYMAKGNPIMHRFNAIVTYIFEAGLFEKWQNNFLSKLRLSDSPIDDDDTDFSDFSTKNLNSDYVTYSFIHLRVIFYMLLAGHVCSTLVFLAEIVYCRSCITGALRTSAHRPTSSSIYWD
jgi:hypothetical protein